MSLLKSLTTRPFHSSHNSGHRSASLAIFPNLQLYNVPLLPCPGSKRETQSRQSLRSAPRGHLISPAHTWEILSVLHLRCPETWVGSDYLMWICSANRKVSASGKSGDDEEEVREVCMGLPNISLAACDRHPRRRHFLLTKDSKLFLSVHGAYPRTKCRSPWNHRWPPR